MLKKYIINSRSDLDAIQGTPEYDEFMNSLKGSMTRKHIWEDIEDLTTITSFGFTKEDFV